MKVLACNWMPISHFQIGWVGIILPISYSVTNHDSLKVWFDWSIWVIHVIIIDLIGKIWDINSCVWFTCDIQWVCLILWELSQPMDQEFSIVLSTLFVCLFTALRVFLVVASGESNSCWLLYVEDVCFLVPWMFIFDKNCLAIRKVVGSMFSRKGEHGWTSWTSIEPNN